MNSVFEKLYVQCSCSLHSPTVQPGKCPTKNSYFAYLTKKEPAAGELTRQHVYYAMFFFSIYSEIWGIGAHDIESLLGSVCCVLSWSTLSCFPYLASWYFWIGWIADRRYYFSTQLFWSHGIKPVICISDTPHLVWDTYTQSHPISTILPSGN